MTRVLVAQMSHESNGFNPVPTTLVDFQKCGLDVGSAVVERFRGADCELGGFIDTLEAAGAEPVGAVAASCIPSGPVLVSVVDGLVQSIVGAAAAERPDGVLLALHGAMLGDDGEQSEVVLLRRLRAELGPDIPIFCTLDLHANLADETVSLTQALIPYDLNPHRDLRERGVEAAELLLRYLAGRVRPVMALARIPLLLSPVNQGTSDHPMRLVMEAARRCEERLGILNVGVLPGFPYCDLPEAGFSVVAIADGDRALADEAARAVAAVAWELRADFTPSLPDAATAVARAAAATGDGPVVVAEVTDNVNAGAPGDGTHLLAQLLRTPVPRAVFACIADPGAVAAAIGAGVGSMVTLTVGGRTVPICGDPLELRARVRLISDGRFLNVEANNGAGMLKGSMVEMGRTVVLEVPEAMDLTVIVTERRVPPIGPELFRSLGIEPSQMRVLAVKTRALYWRVYPFVQELVETETPGLASSDLRNFQYRRLRRPRYPLDAVEAS